MIGRSMMEPSFKTMSFQEAMDFLRQAPRGAKITRVSWDKVYVVKRYNSKTKLFEYYIRSDNGYICEFIITAECIKAKDWYIIEDDD